MREKRESCAVCVWSGRKERAKRAVLACVGQRVWRELFVRVSVTERERGKGEERV